MSEILKGPCGSEYLHQKVVKAKWREKEDGPGVEHTTCDRGMSNMMVSKEDIPGRRDSMDVFFYCEECDKDHVLRLTQHKGMTLKEWVR